MSIEKSVKIYGTLYTVGIDEKGVYASYVVYPHPGWGNNYGSKYRFIQSGKKWVEIREEGWNYGWACRGRGMEAVWSDNLGFVRKEEAEAFLEKIRAELEDAEDGTPDVKEIYDKIIGFIENLPK